MPRQTHELPDFDRRRFLRRAATVAGAFGVGGMATNLAGCCDPPPSTPAVSKPNSPSGLTATPVSSTAIELAWTDNAEDETGFELERALEGDVFTRVALLGIDALTYVDTGLPGGTTFRYRVRAVGAEGASDYAPEVSAATLPTPVGAPAAPTGLAGSELSLTGVTLTWNDNADDESSYLVERKSGDGEFLAVATLAPGATLHVLENLAPATRHEFRVRAVNEVGISDPSNVLRVRTDAVVEALAVAPDGTPGRLVIDWTDRTAGAVAFRIERRIGTAPFQSIGTVISGKREFVDAALVPGSEHAYRVMADDELSLDVPPVAIAVPELPATPDSFLVANDPADGSRVVVSWASGDASVARFHLERKNAADNATTFAELALLPDGLATSFADTGGTPLNPFDYRVRASNAAGYSPYTDVGTAQQRAVFKGDAITVSGSVAAVLTTVGKGAAVTIRRNAVELGSGCRTSSNPARVWLIRKSESVVTAVLAHCTHACLTLPSFQWQEANSRFICAHGSTFTADGQIVNRAVSGQGSVPTLRTELFPDRVEVFR